MIHRAFRRRESQLTSSFKLAFLKFAFHLFSIHFFAFGIVPCGTNEFALEIIDVSFAIEKVLLLVAFDLNSAQTFLGQILRIVHINYIIFVFIVLSSGRAIIHAHHAAVAIKVLLASVLLLFLQRQQLAFGEAFVVNVAIRLSIILDPVLVISLLMELVVEVRPTRVHHGQLVDLIHDESVLAR